MTDSCRQNNGLHKVKDRHFPIGRLLVVLLLTGLLLTACGKDDASVIDTAQKESVSADQEKERETDGEGVLSEGSYQVDVLLEGGSGKAHVETPATLTVQNGKMTVQITWSSNHYDYMMIDGADKIFPINTEGNSVFEFEIAGLNQQIPVVADTTAMGTPHEIEYTLTFSLPGEGVEQQTSEDKASGTTGNAGKADATGPEWDSLEKEGALSLDYAKQYYVNYLSEGYKLIHIETIGNYLLIPKEAGIPKHMPEDIILLQQPLDHTYLAATAAMDLICRIDALPNITLTGTSAENWYIQDAIDAMHAGSLEYAGKYSAPDYEMLLAKNCSLALQSTMILHNPEVKEQLERLGIPVMIERSSYEDHPLGRLEWIKLYGLLWEKEQAAENYFAEQKKIVDQLGSEKKTGKTVGFFSFNTSGGVVVQKTNGYVPKMIELAGGSYALGKAYESDSSLSTMTLQMEEFYGAMVDADYLVYNGSINGGMDSLSDLLRANPLMADFKAVKEGHIYSCGKDMFQKVSAAGDMIQDFHLIMTQENPILSNMYKLE